MEDLKIINQARAIVNKDGSVHKIRGHSITTWTRRGGEGGSQMSTIVHVREGGGIRNVHVDKIFGKCSILAPTRRHKFIFGNVNMGCDLLLHFGLALGTYLKVILN